MNDQKKTKDKKFSKHLSIGSPSDFQHRWHVIYDSTHLRLTGVPPQWQKNIAQTESLFRYRSVNTLFTAKKDRRLQNICSDANRRSRTSSIVFNTPQFKTDVIVAELNETRVIAENPANLFDGVTIKTDFGPYTIFYGHKEGKKELFALKHLMVENSFQYNDLKNELEFLTKFSHQNIIQFVEAFTWDSFCLIVFNDYEDMSLHEIINNMYHVLIRSAKKNFSHDETAYITHSILCGLQFMHSKRYVNLDIKSDTILVSSEGIVRISDFGICRKIDGLTITSDICGTPYWMAPEIASKQPYNFSADIWSLGCVVIEMMTGSPPLYGFSPADVLLKLPTVTIDEIMPPLISEKFGAFSRSFLACCVAIKKNERATASLLLIHPFLTPRSTPSDVIFLRSDLSLV